MMTVVALAVSGFAAAADVLPAANPTQEALLALDTDGSGKVERSEIEAFARRQGLAAAEVQSEFNDLDTDGDGELSAAEISSTLSQPEVAGAASTPPATNAVAPAAASAAQSVPAVGGALEAQASVAAADTKAIEANAQQTAAKTLAEVFAHSAAGVLAARGQDVEKAAKLEEAAKSLRGQTAELRRTAAQVTAEASRLATEAVLHESTDEVKKLQAEATAAAKEASDRRAHASSAMQLVLKAQAEMRTSVTQMGNEPA